MKFSQSLLATFSLLSLASATERRWLNETVWTTKIVTAYTTYCPAPTTVVANNQTYIVTTATTLTITNCPCTISGTVLVGNATTASQFPSATPVNTAGSGSGGGSSGGSGGGSGGGGSGGGSGSTASGTSTTTPVLATGAAVALGSSFGALILGGVAAVLL